MGQQIPVMGDHVALLSAFSIMGLKLRMDLPEQAMEVTTVFFRNSTPASEAAETLKNFSEERAKKMKALQEKMKLDDKEAKRFSPVDAFPGDIVIFARVLNLLRGLSATMEVRIVYFDIMRPFAESVLGGIINMGPATNTQWLCDTPVHSDVEGKLRKLLIDLGNAGKILGIQDELAQKTDTSVSPPRTSLATQHLSITAPQKTSNMAAKGKQTAAQ